jgi:basic amino acid/polyamine antiporter, APA family
LPPTDTTRPLARTLGLFSASMVVLSAMVGGGIFINPSLVAQILHRPAPILLAWTLGGLLALVGAFVFAELATVVPRAGGEYAFLREAFHPFVGFLYGWTLLFVIGSGAVSALAVALCEYLVRLLQWPHAAVGPLALSVVLGLTAYHALGIRPGMILINVLTVCKLAVLIALFAAAILAPGLSPVEPASMAVATSSRWSDVSLFFAALVPVMYVYSGWQKLSYIAEEVVQPLRNLPRAILLGVTLVVALYLLANIAYLRVLGANGVAHTETPAADVAARLWGQAGGRFMGAVVIASIFGSLNLALMTTPRVYYALARDGLMTGSMAHVSERFRVPTMAILLQGAVGAALAASGSFGQLVQYKVFGEWVFLMLSGLALLQLRRRFPLADRPMPVPLYPLTPIVFFLAAAGIVVNALLTDTLHALECSAVIACGIPAYAWVARRARAVA